MTDSMRPKCVVIVDADNPLRDFYGEFFWLEDRNRVVASERELAFRKGYERGRRDASAHATTLVVRGRRPRVTRFLVWFAVLALALCFLTPLIGSMTR